MEFEVFNPGGVKTMKLADFKSLSRDEQVTILYQEGVYIGKKKVEKLTVLLYQLESFYVELFYSSYRRSIQKLRVTDSTFILDPYLEQIEIEYLVT
jgi:hypothetical protein